MQVVYSTMYGTDKQTYTLCSNFTRLGSFRLTPNNVLVLRVGTRRFWLHHDGCCCALDYGYGESSMFVFL